MPTYIILGRWTQKGIENVKDSPSRLDKFKQAVKQAGGNVTGFYLTFGQYDFLAISEAPDDETCARLTLATGALGNARTETLKAFSEAEYRKIIQSLT